MNKLLLAGALAMGIIAQPALAVVPPVVPVVKTPAPTIIYTPGIYALPSWTTAKVFQNFQAASTSGAYVAAAGETVTGHVDADWGLSFGGAALTNKYLSITSGGTYAVSFASAVQYFSFSVHSLNSTDKVTLSFANGTSLALLGTQIAGAAGSGLASLLDTSGRVNVDMHGRSGITSVLFGSTSDCTPFRIDNLAAAAPEPGTWGMMILGFGLAGAALRRPRRSPQHGAGRIAAA